MFTRIRQLLELIRFSHTVFALPFALLAAVMAWVAAVASVAEVSAGSSWWASCCAWCFARSAAMAFNRLVDRDAGRPESANANAAPAGRAAERRQRGAVRRCSAALGFIAATLLFLPNRWPLYLSVPVLLFLLGYSYTKRFTALAHFWLGAALMLAPVAAWIAVRGEVAWPPVVLGGGGPVVGGRLRHHLRLPGRGGRPPAGPAQRARRLGVPTGLAAGGPVPCWARWPCCLALPLVYPYLGVIYWTGIAAVGLLLVYEHWIVRPDDLTRVNVAFFNVNAVISIGLLVIGSIDLIL